jgi:hypothetical protein
VCLATAGLLAATVAACGDDTPSSPRGSAENPLVAQPADSEAAADGRSNEAASAPEGEQAKPGFQELLNRQSANPRSRFSPCTLVSQPRARDILGATVQAPVEAPQGPTCIYRTEDGEQFVTLAVQALDFRAQKRLMEDPEAVDVSSRSAYCGTLGEPTLYVRLSGTQVLSVGAPCDVAKRFAAAAMQRLDS